MQIDHGYTLPSTFADVSFEWLYWPQARVPFDAPTRAYIASLSAEADLATLAAHGLQLSAESERVFRASSLLLQKVCRRPSLVELVQAVTEQVAMRQCTSATIGLVAFVNTAFAS